jgi:hypothetical protein
VTRTRARGDWNFWPLLVFWGLEVGVELLVAEVEVRLEVEADERKRSVSERLSDAEYRVGVNLQ